MSRLGRIGGFFGRLAAGRRSALPDTQPVRDLGPREPVNDAAGLWSDDSESNGGPGRLVLAGRARASPDARGKQRQTTTSSLKFLTRHRVIARIPRDAVSSAPGRESLGREAKTSLPSTSPRMSPITCRCGAGRSAPWKSWDCPRGRLPSDQVTGLHTGHPEEGPGNTLFHHSFSITFLKVQAPAVVYAEYVPLRRDFACPWRTAVLHKDGEAFSEVDHPEAADTFRFSDLPAGEYVVSVRGPRGDLTHPP